MIAAAVGGLILLAHVPVAQAQSSPAPVVTVASLASGSIGGIVQDENGAPVPGAMVSALGARTATAITDRHGKFELARLAPGPYLVRVHVSGFAASRGQLVDVKANARTTSALAVRRASAPAAPNADTPPAALPIVAAGIGLSEQTESDNDPTDAPRLPADQPSSAATSAEDDHSETAWRLRHLRRGILKDVTVPDALMAGADDGPGAGPFADLGIRSDAAAGLASNLFAGVPLTGQFNLLTTGSFDTPQQLFTGDNFSRSIASVSLASPVGDHADWSMRGALTQGDISSWFVAGAYATRLPASHRYALGLSYSTQRYDGGNFAALREVTDGSRNVGAVYGFDTFTVTPAIAVTYGARFSRYDYLGDVGLLSPRVELALSPAEHFRVGAMASSRGVAPGAEEFLPPIDVGLWLPPQRTFSSIIEGQSLRPERTEHVSVEAERDFGASTISVGAFTQHIDDQLVTMFGVDSLGTRPALGHYFVGTAGDVDAIGWTAAFRTTLASRVHGSIEYTSARARWSRPQEALLLLLTPSSAPGEDRINAVATTVETDLPETSTRILVIARLSSGRLPRSEGQGYDPRFDVQVHQSLPFMDFSSARWEMLLAVRNTFHEAAADASMYDELLVVRPPKRLVGGLTVRF
jgi:hypothetical protein